MYALKGICDYGETCFMQYFFSPFFIRPVLREFYLMFRKVPMLQVICIYLISYLEHFYWKNNSLDKYMSCIYLPVKRILLKEKI